MAVVEQQTFDLDRTEVSDFLIYEAGLLDDQKWREWSDLFTEDGEYWVPASFDQPDPVNHVSHVYENKLLREVRIRRFGHPNAFSLQPMPRSVHLVSNIVVDEASATSDTIVVKSRFIMLQSHRDEQTTFGGAYRHHLKLEGGALKIIQKRVDLINCESALGNILTYL